MPNVRHEASLKMYVILKILYSEKVYRECIIRSIIDFSQADKYTKRQSFLVMCIKLIRYADVFKRYFLSTLASMINDKVVNVRIFLARVLMEIVEKKNALIESEII